MNNKNNNPYINIIVPEGYEIDTVNSTFECIKFKKIQSIKTWDDLCKAGAISNGIRLNGFCIDYNSSIWKADGLYIRNENRDVYLTEKEARSARAVAMISQLMPYYGGAITNKEWDDSKIWKNIIFREGKYIKFNCCNFNYHYLAFHTKKQRDEFYDNNTQLVKDYLMIEG